MRIIFTSVMIGFVCLGILNPLMAPRRDLILAGQRQQNSV